MRKKSILKFHNFWVIFLNGKIKRKKHMQNELFQYCPDMILFRRRYGRIIKKVIIALICLQVLYYLNLPLPHGLYRNAQGRGRRSYQNNLPSRSSLNKFIYNIMPTPRWRSNLKFFDWQDSKARLVNMTCLNPSK